VDDGSAGPGITCGACTPPTRARRGPALLAQLRPERRVTAGFAAARVLVATMDGDRQNDPADLPA
jgi:hypothetical protein